MSRGVTGVIAAGVYVAYLFSGVALAQTLEPRAFADTPVDLNFFVAAYSYSDGGVLTDPTLPVEDGQLSVHGLTLGYVRSLAIAGRSAKMEFTAPYAWASGSATFQGMPRTREISGFADPKLRFSLNLLKGSARTLRESIGAAPRTVVGATLSVTLPVGQYDDTKLVNIGTNRWSMKAQLGMSRPFGRLTFELAGGVTIFGDNDSFFGNTVREQDALYSLQAHLIYQFRPGLWGAFGGTHYTGGRTVVGGVISNDLQESTRMGAALVVPLSRYDSIKLFVDTGVALRIGSDFDTMGIAWQRRWGGDL